MAVLKQLDSQHFYNYPVGTATIPDGPPGAPPGLPPASSVISSPAVSSAPPPPLTNGEPSPLSPRGAKRFKRSEDDPEGGSVGDQGGEHGGHGPPPPPHPHPSATEAYYGKSPQSHQPQGLPGVSGGGATWQPHAELPPPPPHPTPLDPTRWLPHRSFPSGADTHTMGAPPHLAMWEGGWQPPY